MVDLSSVSFGGSTEPVRNATFGVAASTFCAIVGPAGAGQATVLRLIAGLLEPTHGTIVREVPARLVTLGRDGIPRFSGDPGDGGLVLIDALERQSGTVRDAALLLALHRLSGRGVTVVAALRDLSPAVYLADQVILMRDGEVVTDGSPHVVLVPKILESVYARAQRPARRRPRYRLHPARG